MKFLLSFLMWVFGADMPADVTLDTQPQHKETHVVQTDHHRGTPNTILKDRNKRFGTHIIIFEDTHFRRRKN